MVVSLKRALNRLITWIDCVSDHDKNITACVGSYRFDRDYTVHTASVARKVQTCGVLPHASSPKVHTYRQVGNVSDRRTYRLTRRTACRTGLWSNV